MFAFKLNLTKIFLKWKLKIAFVPLFNSPAFLQSIEVTLFSESYKTTHFFLHSLLDAVMKEPVLIQHDDDVTVFNRPEAEEYYHTKGPPSLDDEM